jgi:hypothetical protein
VYHDCPSFRETSSPPTNGPDRGVKTSRRLKEGEIGGGFWRYDVRDHDELTLNRRPVMILSRESTGQVTEESRRVYGVRATGFRATAPETRNDQAMTREMRVTDNTLLNLQYRWGTERVF